MAGSTLKAAAITLISVALACGNGEQSTITTRPHPDVDAEGIGRLLAAIEDGRYGEVHSVVLLIDGELVLEAYFAGYDRNDRQALYSVTKSVLAALFGIAIADGHIGSAGDRVLEYFPEYQDLRNLGPDKLALTIDHLLSMTAGLQWDELSLPYDDPGNDYRRYLASKDRVRYALGLPMAHPPGRQFGYNTALSQILSVILTRATGRSAAELARERLFTPLGIDNWRWTAYDSTTSVGGAGLYLRAIDMAKIGQLFLQRGAWNGRQVVPARWVEACTSAHCPVDRWHDYGYHWWRYSKDAAQSYLNGHEDISYALGRGGQYVWVLPFADAVLVCTAWNDNNGCWPEAMLWDFVGPSLDGG